MFSDCGDVMIVRMGDHCMKLSRIRSICGKDDSHFSSCFYHHFRRGNLKRRSLNKNGGGEITITFMKFRAVLKESIIATMSCWYHVREWLLCAKRSVGIDSQTAQSNDMFSKENIDKET